MVQDQRPSAVKIVVSVLITILIFPAIILVLSGDWRWLEGWIFSLWFAAMIVATTVYLAIYDPALLAERSRMRFAEDQKRWDRSALTMIYVLMFAWFIIMPLDAKASARRGGVF